MRSRGLLALVALLVWASAPAAQIRVRVAAPNTTPVTITLTSMPSALEDVAYATQTVTVIGGTAPYTCAVTTGSLPTGITETAECVYGGTPTTPSTSNFTVTATDNVAATDTQDYSIVITAAGSLPNPWAETEIGTGQTAGDCAESASTWTVTGAGIVYNTADQLRFCYQATTGNKVLIARVTACATGAFQCGIMVRASLDANATNSYCFRSEVTNISQYRLTTGGATGDEGGLVDQQYVRLIIVGSTATCYHSDNGTTWTQIGSGQDLTLSATYYLGLAVNSNTNGTLSSGTFTTVSIATWVPPDTGSDYGGYRAHLQGYGSTTTGGRTGGDDVCHVTTTADEASGTWGASGSVRDCFEGLPGGCTAFTGSQASCARFVVFDVSGVFTGTTGGNSLRITGPYLTIAGQTAPTCSEGTGTTCTGTVKGGFEFRETAIFIDAHTVVIQHLAVRRPPAGLNAISIGDGGDMGSNTHVHDILLDHVSLSWTDFTNNVSCPNQGACNSVQIVDSLFFEPLYQDPAFCGAGSCGGVGMAITQQPNCFVTIARNAFINSHGRNPVFAYCNIAIYNNLVYNASDDIVGRFASVDSTQQTSGAEQTHITNNVIIAGPNVGSPAGFLCLYKINSTSLGGRIYLAGNTGPGITAQTDPGQWAGTYLCSYDTATNVATAGTASNIRTASPFGWWSTAAFAEIPNTGTLVRTAVVNNAGSRPLDRSFHDDRVLDDVTDGGGNNVISWASIVSTYGGHHGIAARSRTVTMPANPNNAGTCGGSRTIAECFLDNDAAFGNRRLEVSWGPPP